MKKSSGCSVEACWLLKNSSRLRKWGGENYDIWQRKLISRPEADLACLFAQIFVSFLGAASCWCRQIPPNSHAKCLLSIENNEGKVNRCVGSTRRRRLWKSNSVKSLTHLAAPRSTSFHFFSSFWLDALSWSYFTMFTVGSEDIVCAKLPSIHWRLCRIERDIYCQDKRQSQKKKIHGNSKKTKNSWRLRSHGESLFLSSKRVSVWFSRVADLSDANDWI